MIEEAQDLAVQEHNVEFKTNLWVAESFANCTDIVKGRRRHARGRVAIVSDARFGSSMLLDEVSQVSFLGRAVTWQYDLLYSSRRHVNKFQFLFLLTNECSRSRVTRFTSVLKLLLCLKARK